MSRLIGWVWMQSSGSTGHRANHGRVRQRLQGVVQIDPGQRPLQFAVLATDTLAIDDQQRRAELTDQATNLARLEWVDIGRLAGRFHRQ